MFGDDEVAESLYTERAKVLDRALKTLRRDKTVFGTLVKEAETVETAGNVLAKDINEQRAIADGQALQILQTLANRTGSISDALRTAAAAAKTDGYAAAARQFVATVREAVSSGELTRAADGIERGATHVGDETTAATIDRGLAAEPSKPSAVDAADRQITDMIHEGPTPRSFWSYQAATETPPPPPGMTQKDWESLTPGMRREIARQAAQTARVPAYEPGAEGLPQGIMPGMESSARQLAAARAGPLRAGVPQAAPGDLFAPPPERMPDMFFDAGGQPQNLEHAIDELDQFKIAADQIAACAAPQAAEAA
jgi:hypothetical protein